MTSLPHSELAALIDRALASPYGVPYEESHAAREALHSLVEQLETVQRDRDTYREALELIAAIQDSGMTPEVRLGAADFHSRAALYPASRLE